MEKHSPLFLIFTTKFISLQLNLTLKSADGGDTSTYVENGEWSLLGTIDVNYQF